MIRSEWNPKKTSNRLSIFLNIQINQSLNQTTQPCNSLLNYTFCGEQLLLINKIGPLPVEMTCGFPQYYNSRQLEFLRLGIEFGIRISTKQLVMLTHEV